MTASLELCRELYELSGWEGDKDWRHEPKAPAYDCGYLLRKLPYSVLDEYQSKVYGVKLKATASGGWVAWYGEIGQSTEMYFNSADTPEDAICSLAISLFRNGVLKNE